MFEVLYTCQHRYLPVVLYICKYPSKYSHSNYVIKELKTPCFLKFRQLQFSFFDDSFGHILDSWDVLHAPCGHFSENWGKFFLYPLLCMCNLISGRWRWIQRTAVHLKGRQKDFSAFLNCKYFSTFLKEFMVIFCSLKLNFSCFCVQIRTYYKVT